MIELQHALDEIGAAFGAELELVDGEGERLLKILADGSKQYLTVLQVEGVVRAAELIVDIMLEDERS